MMDEGREDEAIIPEEDFREAIAACCEDPQLKRYFRLAPPGAKLFIGLGFYSTHFGERVDPRQYAECQAEIEPSLTVNDLKYLIRFEDDKETRRYLRRLLTRREETQESPVPEERQPLSVSADAIPVPRRRRRRKASSAGLRWILRKDAVRRLPLACKAAALVAVLIGGAVAVKVERLKVERVPPTTFQPLNLSTSQLPDAATNVPVALSDAVAVAAPAVEPPPAAVPAEPPPEPAAQIAQAAEKPERKDEPVAVESAAAVKPAPARKKTPRSPRVVFTDGRRIVRHPGGKVEVPRVFSCAGAGVKPFWVYGPNPEVEAEKERKARREWRALVELASRRAGER